MCEKCRDENVRAAVALASAAFVALPEVKDAEKLAAIFAVIREAYQDTKYPEELSTGADMNALEKEFNDKVTGKLYALVEPDAMSGAQASTILGSLESFAGAINSATSTVRAAITERVRSGQTEGVADRHVQSAQNLLDYERNRENIPEIVRQAVERAIGGAAQVEFVGEYRHGEPVQQFGVGKAVKDVS